MPLKRWNETVVDVIADLESMNRQSEAGFLAVGGELATFLSISKRISADSCAIADLISGEQGRHACDALLRLLDRIREKSQGASSEDRIPELRDLGSRLHRCFAGFDGTAFAFKQVATLAGIEIGRLEQRATSLTQLTAEMRSSSADIRERVALFLEAADLLDRRLDSLLSRIAEVEDRESQAIPPLAKAIGGSLEDFRTRQQRSERAARELGSQFADLARAIGDIVISIQCHDITRQQIEHIGVALLRLGGEEGGAASDELGPDAAIVIGLQLAHLEDAARTFEASIREIDRGLATVAERVQEMAAESASLTDRPSIGSDSFFAEMQKSFAAIAGVTGDYANLERSEQSAVAELSETIRRLMKALAEIEAVGMNLRLLALNTVIQARQLGTEGEPLKAVAGAVRELQVDFEARLREGSEILRKIESDIAVLGGREEIQPVLEELSARMNELQASAGRSGSACQEIAALAAGLCSQVRTAREIFAESHAFEGTLERSGAALRGLLSGLTADEGQNHNAAWLAEHAGKYTMQSQREIHGRVLGQSAEESESAVCGEVELF